MNHESKAYCIWVPSRWDELERVVDAQEATRIELATEKESGWDVFPKTTKIIPLVSKVRAEKPSPPRFSHILQ